MKPKKNIQLLYTLHLNPNISRYIASAAKKDPRQLTIEHKLCERFTHAEIQRLAHGLGMHPREYFSQLVYTACRRQGIPFKTILKKGHTAATQQEE